MQQVEELAISICSAPGPRARASRLGEWRVAPVCWPAAGVGALTGKNWPEHRRDKICSVFVRMNHRPRRGGDWAAEGLEISARSLSSLSLFDYVSSASSYSLLLLTLALCLH